jgi:hypothetical protein
MMGMLLPLGIEKSKEFKPDAATVAGLNSAQHGELNKYQKKDSLKKWGEATQTRSRTTTRCGRARINCDVREKAFGAGETLWLGLYDANRQPSPHLSINGASR